MDFLLILLIFTLHTANGVVVTAIGKPATSSSVRSPEQGPEIAVDGDLNQLGPVIFHSGTDTLCWWQVDILEEVTSPRITIYFRTDGPGALKRNGVRVSWSNTSGIPNVFCHTIIGAPDGSDIPGIYNVTSCTGRGRYLTISTVTDNGADVRLDLGEVDVHACSLTTYGAGCNLTCHCAGTTCDGTSGVCPSGCAAGWKGSNCNTLVISTNDVNIASKYLSACNVNVGYEQTTVSMATLIAMEIVSRTTRVECMHACDALVLCTAFTFTAPDCSLWMSGNSDLTGTQLVWTKSSN